MEESYQQMYLLKSVQQIYLADQHNQALSYFFNSNRIISSHTPTHNFFKNFSEHPSNIQTTILNQILTALRTVSTNAYLLNQQIKGKYQFNLDRYEESHHERHIISYIVDLMMKNVNNYHTFNLLLQILEQLLPYSPLEDLLLYEAISKLTVNFNKSQVRADQNFAATTIVKAYFHAKIMMEKDPNNMLVFHGENKIQIIPSRHKPLTWILKEGYTVFFWINLENIKSTNDVSLPKLFTFYAPEAGGVQSYLIDNKLYYRIIGAKYTEPQIGSNGIFLGQIQNKKWTFIAIEHEGHHTFQKSKLKCYINKSKPAIFNLDPPKISSSAKTKYIFFDKIYCKSSSICLFPLLIGQQGVDEFNKNINSIQCVKNSKAYVFENRQGKVYERSGLGSSHNYIFERSGNMNFEIIIPLYFMPKFQEKSQEYPILNQLLNILILFLRQSSSNQLQAWKGQYFNIISQIIVDGPQNPFDQNTIKSILHIKHTITDSNLLDQYFSDFLWPLLYAKIPLTRKQEILQIIKNAFTQNIAHYSTLIGLDQMINVLQIIGGGSLTCCEKHFKIATNKFERQLLEGDDTVFGQQKKALSYIFALIESTLQNSKLHFPHEIYKLCRLLSLKCSPCFILELMSLIRKLLAQKFTERMSENQTRQIIKYFQEKKIHYLFIHLIQNQFFAEIKAESVKLIYSLLLKRSTIDQSQISNIISKALWKINEFAQQKNSPVLSRKGSSLDEQSPTKKCQDQYKRSVIPQIEKDQDKPFQLVGPQAPALSNRLKGNKTFDFGFITDKKQVRSTQIMEEEKTTEPLQFLNNNKPFQLSGHSIGKKDKGKFGLTINTDAINEMYTFGGEKGQQIIISEDEQLYELERIVKLAKVCINKMKGCCQEEKQQIKQVKKKPYMLPPVTTTNKMVANKKQPLNLCLISEEDQSPSVKIPTPLATKKSNKTPTSIKSSNQQNLYTLYNSLLESCLGVSFQTCLISNSKVQVPSILSIFFKWIPQTDLQTKFLNDLDIILESSENMALVIQLPQLYDFLFQLCYKCLLYEQMKEKRIYVQKLQNIIKVIFAYIYRDDVGGISKFSYLLNWVDEKKTQHYQPKCLFLTSRYVPLLILECIEELLIMNNSNNPIMERNFQSLAIVLDALKKVFPEDDDDINVDNFERIIMTNDFELPASLIPYFKSDWADFILYQKYLFIFKRFYCTDLYNRGFKNFSQMKNDFLTLLMQSSPSLLQRQASYYLRNNFLISLIEIQRAMLLEIQHTQPKEAEQFGNEAVWQTILLVTMVQTNKQKTIKSQRSEIILSFLKSCKLLAQKGIERIVEIVSMLSEIKHYLSISNKQAQNTGKLASNTVILDDIISNYIPEYLLNMRKTDLETFIMNFSEVWIPNENQYKKIHSDLFLSSRQKNKRQKQFNFIEFVTNIVEQQNERRQYTDVLLDAHSRTLRNYCRKAWTQLRIYNPLWTHPQFKWQHNHLFTKSYYSYERYERNPYFKYKISKQMSKNKGRYLLKPSLNEPQIVKKFNKEQEETHPYQFNLEKALVAMNQSIIIGVPKKSWIVSKGEQSLYFVMGFKKVKIINTLTARSGYIAIISDNLVFISSKNKQKESHLAMDQYKMKSEKSLHKTWALQYIKEVHRRRYVNKKKGVFIFFIHGKGLAIDFQTQDDAEDFCKKIAKLKNKCVNLSFVSKSPDPKKYFESLDYMKKWLSYQLSNFDYLMQLNIFSGRSFNDLTQYPVFPWTLINFGENKPDYYSQSQIRNLSCPMGACGSEDRVHNFEQRYEAMHMDDEYATNFHYGTHYSSPGIIYHFLIRLSPYTEGSILLQSGKFDFADRLFFSLADSYKNATSQYSDVRQLVPEMYSIPEAYLNLNGLNFGVMQNKKRVHNLQLPEWAKDNPYFYVYHLRKTLEQDHVSKTINNWIDLIFGYKQRGQQAVKSLNCFYYLTYEDALPWDKLGKDHDIQSLESQIVNFGQTPSQLFLKPHPERNTVFSLKNYRMICDLEAEPRVYRPTKNTKQVNQDEIQLNILQQPDESIIFMKWVSQSKVVFIRKSGDVIFYKCSPNTNAASKVPFQCTVQKQKKLQRLRKTNFDLNEYYDLSLDVLNFPMELIGGGHTLCIGGLCDGKLVLIDVDTGHSTNIYHCHFHTICCIKADSSRQNFLVTGDIKGNVIMWEIKTSHNISKLIQKKSFRDQYDQITSIFFSSQLLSFAIASKDGSVFLYNTITGSKQRVYYHPKRLPISEVVITTNPLAAILLFCNDDNTIYTFSINGMLISRLHEKMFSYFLSPVIVRDSKLFEYVIFGNERSQVHVRTLPFLQSPIKNMYKVARDVCVNKICISKNNRFLVTGCSDGQLTIITDPNTIIHP